MDYKRQKLSVLSWIYQMNIFKLHCSAQFCVSLAYALLVHSEVEQSCSPLENNIKGSLVILSMCSKYFFGWVYFTWLSSKLNVHELTFCIWNLMCFHVIDVENSYLKNQKNHDILVPFVEGCYSIKSPKIKIKSEQILNFMTFDNVLALKLQKNFIITHIHI